MVSALLLLVGFLTLMPISPVSTYTGGPALAMGRSTGGHIWNSTSLATTLGSLLLRSIPGSLLRGSIVLGRMDPQHTLIP